MPVVVVILHHLLNVFVQLANKRGLKKKELAAQTIYQFLPQAKRLYHNVQKKTATKDCGKM
jgi:hypothetical protein